MAKKSFDTQEATSKFFTQSAAAAADTQENHDTQNPHYTHEKHDNDEIQNPQRKQGRPRLTPDQRKRQFRYSLTLDGDLNQFLHEIAWQNRKSMTQYLNDLIRREKEAYIAECKAQGKDPFEGWENWDEA